MEPRLKTECKCTLSRLQLSEINTTEMMMVDWQNCVVQRGKKRKQKGQRFRYGRGTARRSVSVDIAFEKACSRWMFTKVTQGRCSNNVFMLHCCRDIYRQHCAQRKPAGISFTQRPILRFFAPQGRHVAPMGVKFGMEEGTEPPTVQRQGCRTPKIEIFTQIWPKSGI